MPKTLIIFIFSLLCLFAQATNYYVNDNSLNGDFYTNTTGNSAYDGLSPFSPKRKISEILTSHLIAGGDTLFIDAGIYLDSLYLENINGTPSSPLVIMGKDSLSTQILQLSGKKTLNINECSHLQIKNIGLISQNTNNPQNVCRINKASNLLFENCSFRMDNDQFVSTIQISSAANYASGNITFNYCQIYNDSSNGFWISGFSSSAKAYNINIHNCHIISPNTNRDNPSIGIRTQYVDGLSVQNNAITFINGIVLNRHTQNSVISNNYGQCETLVWTQDSNNLKTITNTLIASNQFDSINNYNGFGTAFLLKNANNITLDSNTMLKGSYIGISIENSDTILLQANTIINSSYGVYASQCGNLQIHQNYIQNHSINGIYTSNSHQASIQHNTVANCPIGINISYSNNNLLAYNHVTSENTALQLETNGLQTNFLIEHNQLISNNSYTISIIKGNAYQINYNDLKAYSNNTSNASVQIGSTSASNQNTINGNNITSHGIGIFLQSGISNTITNNFIITQTEGFFSNGTIANSAGSIISHNSFYTGKHCIAYNQNGGQLNNVLLGNIFQVNHTSNYVCIKTADPSQLFAKSDYNVYINANHLNQTNAVDFGGIRSLSQWQSINHTIDGSNDGSSLEIIPGYIHPDTGNLNIQKTGYSPGLNMPFNFNYSPPQDIYTSNRLALTSKGALDLQVGLKGNYTLNPNLPANYKNYQDLQSFLNDITSGSVRLDNANYNNGPGIKSNVTLSIAPGTYSGEFIGQHLTLPGNTDTLFIVSENNNPEEVFIEDIEDDAENYALKIMASNTIVFRGISFINSLNNYRSTLVLDSVDHILFDHCIFANASASNSTNLNDHSLVRSNNSHNSLKDIIFNNCQFTYGNGAIYFEKPTNTCTDISIRNCQFQDQYVSAIYLNNADSSTINKSTISTGLNHANYIGINLIGGDHHYQLSYNNLMHIDHGIGIKIFNKTMNTNTQGLIQNNTIGIGDGSPSNDIGLLLQNINRGPKVYYNSIVNRAPFSNFPAFFHWAVGSQSPTLFRYNNIISTNGGLLIHLLSHTDGYFIADYNNYYQLNNTATFSGKTNSAYISNFTSWQNQSFGPDANSKNLNPEISSPYDMHLKYCSPSELKIITSPGPIDLDNEVRIIAHRPGMDALPSVIPTAGGTYIVDGNNGPNTDFQNITDAECYLRGAGVDAPVTVLVKEGVYNEQVAFGKVFGASNTRDITYQAENIDSGATVVEFNSGTNNNYVFQLNGPAYTTFNGFTLHPLNNNFARAIEIKDNKYFENIKFENGTFIGSINATSNTQSLIYAGADLLFIGFQLSNNAFHSGFSAIELNGGSVLKSTLSIDHNIFRNQSSTNVYLDGIEDIDVLSNEMEANLSANGVGLSLSNISGNYLNIEKNKFLLQGTVSKGIELLNSSLNTSYINLSNNMISLRNPSAGNQPIGISIKLCDQLKLYFNSIRVESGDNNSSAMQVQGVTNMEEKNNIFFLAATNNQGYALNIDNVSSNAFGFSNYYTSRGDNKLILLASTEKTFIQWQNTIGNTQKAINLNPNWLHDSLLLLSSNTDSAFNDSIDPSIQNTITEDAFNRNRSNLGFNSWMGCHHYGVNYHWRQSGGGSGDWNDGLHWSISNANGSLPEYGAIPMLGDPVHFDQYSFTGPGQVIYINGNAYAKTVEFHDNQKLPVFLGEGNLIFGQ